MKGCTALDLLTPAALAVTVGAPRHEDGDEAVGVAQLILHVLREARVSAHARPTLPLTAVVTCNKEHSVDTRKILSSENAKKIHEGLFKTLVFSISNTPGVFFFGMISNQPQGHFKHYLSVNFKHPWDISKRYTC